MKVIRNTLGEIPDDGHKVIRERTLFVLSEFKAPSEKETVAAVAGSIPFCSESKPNIEWIWGAGIAEQMHPF